MQTLHRRLSVIAGFTLLLAVLIANALITRRQLGVQEGDEAWVIHTQQVRFELSRTVSLIKDAETGQRGFLYTGDPKYLAPYDLAVRELNPHIDRLTSLTADSPAQHALMVSFREAAETKMSELARTIELYRDGHPDDARALVLSDIGLNHMEEIRRLSDQMESDEAQLERKRSATYRQSVRRTIAGIYLVNAVAVIGLFLLAYYILREIGIRERHTLQLEEREEWFRSTLTSLGDAVIATDQFGLVTFLNPIAEKLIGIPLTQAKGKPIKEVFPIFNESTHDVVENPVHMVVQQGRIVGLANHTVLRDSKGNFIPIEDSAAPIRDPFGKLVGVVLVFRDASVERQTQEVLRKTEKLAAASRLAATVAHEINNPLEAIGNLLYIARTTPGVPPAAIEQLQLAEQEMERISHITRQTLGFYRESNHPTPIEVADLVESILKIHSNKFATKSITIQRDFAVCPPIQGMAGELKQVVANLISNAVDAAPTAGTIWIRLSSIENGDERFVRITIEDNGPGIAANHRNRIFEPFFTTKKDVGTGLGLWVSKEIVDRHGGTIQVSSPIGDGASGAAFHVHLPIVNSIPPSPEA
jgi:PAS domain S-box-containing protein